MMMPAYAVDHASISYEIRLQQDASVDASKAQPFREANVATPPDTSRMGDQINAVAKESATELSGIFAAEQSGLALDSANPAGTRSRHRAQLARTAYAGGWIFLAIALFCLAQAFSVIAPQSTGRWRAVRAHS